MDRDAVLHHLRAWAEGIDPATGLVLPADHPGQRPDTLRVVFAALALLHATSPADATATSPERQPAVAGPRNAGRAWSPGDDSALASAFDGGESVGAIAAQLQRTRGAINARLVKLGKIEPPPGLRLRGMPSPFADAPGSG